MTSPALVGLAATPAATTAREARLAEPGFYRRGWDGVSIASIGLGTDLGDPDTATDAAYAAALRRYWQLGGNLINSVPAIRCFATNLPSWLGN